MRSQAVHPPRPWLRSYPDVPPRARSAPRGAMTLALAPMLARHAEHASTTALFIPRNYRPLITSLVLFTLHRRQPAPSRSGRTSTRARESAREDQHRDQRGWRCSRRPRRGPVPFTPQRAMEPHLRHRSKSRRHRGGSDREHRTTSGEASPFLDSPLHRPQQSVRERARSFGLEAL